PVGTASAGTCLTRTFPSPTLESATLHLPSPPKPAAAADQAATTWSGPTRPAALAHSFVSKWDLLLTCIAGYILTSVGRIHELFPALQVLRPAMLTGVFAIGLYFVGRDALRGSGRL